jgi:hypothetical protein
MRFLRFVSAAAALTVASGAFASDDFVGRIFGPSAGKGPSYACFTRAYVPTHLAAHPKQNVTTMTLLAVHGADDPAKPIDARLRVTFRSVRGALATGGYCGIAGAAAHCGIECDGGEIDVTLEPAGTALVGIPFRARLWDPAKPDEDPDSVKGKFGADDKTFRLTRTRLADCLPLAYNAGERKALKR